MINKTKQNSEVPQCSYSSCSKLRNENFIYLSHLFVDPGSHSDCDYDSRGSKKPTYKTTTKMAFFTSSLRSNVSRFPPPFPFDLLQFQTIIEPSAAHQQLCRGVLQGERVITVKLASLMPKAAQQINRTLGSSWIFHQVQMIYTDNFSWHLHSAPFYTSGLIFSWTRLVDAFGWLDQLVRDINI